MPSTGEPPPPKVNVSVEVKTLVEISDSGYLGGTASVDDHMVQAIQQAGHWQWFVKKSTTSEPEPIGVRLRVLAVTILPKENE